MILYLRRHLETKQLLSFAAWREGIHRGNEKALQAERVAGRETCDLF